MSSQPLSREVTIRNPQGLHARPADLFVRKASKFSAQVVLIKNDQRANGDSILDLLTLGAEQGAQLTIEAVGEDAEQALATLAEFIENYVAEDD